jgi:hypothetical protein
MLNLIKKICAMRIFMECDFKKLTQIKTNCEAWNEILFYMDTDVICVKKEKNPFPPTIVKKEDVETEFHLPSCGLDIFKYSLYLTFWFSMFPL